MRKKNVHNPSILNQVTVLPSMMASSLAWQGSGVSDSVGVGEGVAGVKSTELESVSRLP